MNREFLVRENLVREFIVAGAKSKPLKPKKSDEELPAKEEDVNGDVSSTSEPEDGASDEPEVKPGPSNATKGKSDKSKATGAKVSKVTVEHCKSWQVKNWSSMSGMFVRPNADEAYPMHCS